MTTLADLLCRSIADRPDAMAVVGDETVTYAELGARAAAVKDALARVGIGSGDRVALFLEKSVDAVAAIHGTLAAGATYVPIDPAAPPARVAALLVDARPAAVVVHDSTADSLVDVAGGAELCAVVSFDDLELATTVVTMDDASTLAVEPDLDPEHPAYVLYTSGSTGRPKGVVISHRAALAFVRWAASTLEVRPDDRLSSHAPFHFDLSILDLFVAAACGATTVLVPRSALVFPRAAVKFVRDQEITIWYSVPSALRMLVDRGGAAPGSLSTLREVIFAGEVYAPGDVRRLMELTPRARHWNFYGPTETNVCTFHRVEAVDTDADLPIGRMVDGDIGIVVGPDGELPDECVGELLVAGETLATGYLDNAQLTVERFVEREHDGEVRTFYRTGDLVTRHAELLRFRGRSDHQVKTRGHRVELGDVEAALHRHDSVRDCVAVAVPDPLVTNRLHAIVESDADVDLASIRASVSATLPAYMVPSISAVESLPRTSTGKVDRKAAETMAAANEGSGGD